MSKSDGYRKSLNVLLVSNAFSVEEMDITELLKKKFSSNCVDVVITNPPWGSPSTEDLSATETNKIALEWCTKNKRTVSDKERSQTFLWKAIDSLHPKGIGILLVSAGIFYKLSKPSVDFRKQLLSSITIDSVFNFTHTRKLFFKESVSPFAIIIFNNSKIDSDNHFIHYWAAKATADVESLQAVLFNHGDLKLIKQFDAITNQLLWKILSWGNHQDEAFISYLKMNSPLRDFTRSDLLGQGFKEGKKNFEESLWLENYLEFPHGKFNRYGPFDVKWLTEVPKKVNRRGVQEVYDGLRLLVKKGIDQKSDPKGKIVARLENQSFCFRNYLHGIKLVNAEEWRYKCLLGILWSSLARYYFFLTSSKWGIWFDEIELDELLNFPTKFPENVNLRVQIVDVVDKLRNWRSTGSMNDKTAFADLENSLDRAIFELYELSDAEKDLINDLCNNAIAYYYSGYKSFAGQPIISPKIISDFTLSSTSNQELTDVSDYSQAFIEAWNKYLDPEDEFNWQIIAPEENTMLAVRFILKRKSESLNIPKMAFTGSWVELLKKEDIFLIPTASRRIYIDGIARFVAKNEIVIVKRNERRFWTRTSAREDAEATLVRAMNMEMPSQQEV